MASNPKYEVVAEEQAVEILVAPGSKFAYAIGYHQHESVLDEYDPLRILIGFEEGDEVCEALMRGFGAPESP